jgi:hypothetical protein
MLVLFIYMTRLATNEIFSPSNKIHREVGRAKDLSTPLYVQDLKGIEVDETSLDRRVSLKYTDTDRKKFVTTRVLITRTCLIIA